MVDSPTRITDNHVSLLDHVYVSDMKLCSVLPSFDSSDHNSVFVVLSRAAASASRFERTVWHYSQADFDSALDDLQSTLPSVNSDHDAPGPNGSRHFSQVWRNSFRMGK